MLGMMLSNFAIANSVFTPSLSPIAFARSTSQPASWALSSLNSFGGYVLSMPTTSLPASLTFWGSCPARVSSFFTSDAALDDEPEDGVELSTQPVSASAATAATAAMGTAVRMRMIVVVLLPGAGMSLRVARVRGGYRSGEAALQH